MPPTRERSPRYATGSLLATPGTSPRDASALGNAAADADYAKAVDLFKRGQYGPARDAFGKLQQATPNDARVWYYGAVINGVLTSNWEGETAQLVARGVEQEKAGRPDATKINAAFADLNPGIKGWLDAYRARAR